MGVTACASFVFVSSRKSSENFEKSLGGVYLRMLKDKYV